MNNQQIKNCLKTRIAFDESAKTIDFKKSHGSYLIDADGKEYLDFCMSFGSCSLGYNHPELSERMMQHSELFINKISNSDMYSEYYCNFINKIFANLPSRFTRGFFIDNGSTAVDFALKTCCDFYARKHKLSEEQVNQLDIVSFRGGFHGRVGYPVSLTTTDPNKTKLYIKHNFTKITVPEVKFPTNIDEVQSLEEKSLSELETALKKNNVIAVIMEPLLSEFGNKIIRKEYLQEVRKITKKYDTFLIMDEIQTFALCGNGLWLSELYSVDADIICLGKKLQIAGFVITDKINEIQDNVFQAKSRISSTFNGSTIDMLRALIILDIIHEENLIENVRKQGRYLLEGLNQLAGKYYPIINNVRGIGLLIAWDMKDTSARDKLLMKLNEKMFILPAGEKSIRIRCALNISKSECDLFLEILEKELN